MAGAEGRHGDGEARFDPGGGAVPSKPHRQRHDGFTPAKQRKFFKALKKTGCISDACRKAGISRNTVRRHRGKWPAFDAKVEAMLAFASTELEAIAWQRATVGAEEKVYREGRLVSVKVKPSDAMLRLLLQGANPGKYGRTGQLPKGAALKRLKQEAEREIRAKLRDRFTATREETEAKVMQVLGKVRRRLDKEAPG